MSQRTTKRDLQAVYQDGDAKMAFDRGATVKFWDGDDAQKLIALLWEKMSAGTPFEECRAAEMASNVAGPDVWARVDQYFAERAAHPNNERRSES